MYFEVICRPERKSQGKNRCFEVNKIKIYHITIPMKHTKQGSAENKRLNARVQKEKICNEQTQASAKGTRKRRAKSLKQAEGKT